MAALASGFRPFFMLAALSACVLMPYWLGLLLLGMPFWSRFAPQLFHAHEMLFGYTVAVIAGFLLTAVQNWTGLPTARQGRLLALAALWILGRAASSFGALLPAWLAATVDLAFLPTLALVVAVPIARSRNLRNVGMPIVLLVLAGANALTWLGALQSDYGSSMQGQRLALDVIALLIVVVGGRIIPGFTANAVPGFVPRARGALDVLAVSAMVSVLLADAVAVEAVVVATCALASLLNLARLFGWGGSATLARPILLVLHVGYACTAAAFGLRALALLDAGITESTTTHLLTVGGIGMMTLGMMARVSLGHTGRPLRLSRFTVVALALIALSTLVRVGGALLWTSHYSRVLVVSGGLWTLAFALYLVQYASILLTPRADGKPG